MRCDCQLGSLVSQYIQEAAAAGVDVASEYKGRDDTSVDVFHVRHLEIAVTNEEPPDRALDQGKTHSKEVEASEDRPHAAKRQKTLKYPHGSQESWRYELCRSHSECMAHIHSV